MITMKIMLDNLQKIKEFCEIAKSVPFDIDVSTGATTLDAKSPMGMMALCSQEPLRLRLLTNDDVEGMEVAHKFEQFKY